MIRQFAAVLIALTSAAPREAAAKADLPDRFAAGRDANGEPCSAARSWTDPRAVGPFDITYVITCRGVAAARRQGAAYAYLGTRSVDDPRCGEARERDVAGIGKVQARLCSDPVLGARMLRLTFAARGRTIVGEAVATAVAPLEAVLRATITRVPPQVLDTPARASVSFDDLPAPPQTEVVAGTTAFDPAIALQAGIALNYRGQFIEASRLLNDAISRLPDDTPALTRSELSLEAGLADSNISQFDAADDHFTRADGLLTAAVGDLNQLSLLQSKRATYRGLDRINRRDWNGAISLLAGGLQGSFPLTDPAILSQLNRPVTSSIGASVSSTDATQISRLLIEAQRNWARSVAYLAIGDLTLSRQALDESVPYVAELQRNVSADGAAALTSRLERQYGRVAARAGRVPEAIERFDCAVAILQGTTTPSGKPCLLADPTAVASGTGSGAPLLAETQLERASLVVRIPGVATETMLASYDAAVEAVTRAGIGGGSVQPAMESYLDLLVSLETANPDPANHERFFRAIQAIGEPAIARQVAQLQTIVTADGPLGARARDRAEAERTIIQLRYQIAAADPADTARRAELEASRRKAEADLLVANIVLGADSRFRAVDDQPVTVAGLREALKPGEYFLKVTKLRTRAYAVVIGRERTFIYSLAAPAAAVDQVAQRVRASIRDQSGRLPFFDVAASFALFKLVAGPAEQTLASARAIVVDPSGPLENLPAGVLVTNRASVDSYLATRDERPNDYSRVAFLGASAELSSALSPRSFLITRNLPASTATKAFIGFGENAPAALAGIPADTRISFGTGCPIAYGRLAEVLNGNRPVSAAEIGIASRALGLSDTPEVVRASFTDTAVLDRSDRGELLDFQVLHFATHGVPETRVDECTRVPPSLVTTLAPPGPAGSRASDGLLTLSEVAQLRLDANLVVLSACETASGVSGVGGRLSGQDESAATLDGLVRAFITANARAVIATYWQVPASRESDDFIAAFYASGRSATIGASLRAAQQRLIAQPEFSHPYFWGAYFLVGDGSKTMLSREAKQAVADR